MKRRTFLKLGTGTAATCLLTACGGSSNAGTDASTGMVVLWNQVALQAIRVTKPGPPMVAPSLAVLHTSMYDAWAAYDSVTIGTQWATR